MGDDTLLFSFQKRGGGYLPWLAKMSLNKQCLIDISLSVIPNIVLPHLSPLYSLFQWYNHILVDFALALFA